MNSQTCIFIILILSFSNSEKITKITWWFAQLKNEIPQLETFGNSSGFDLQNANYNFGKNNVKGTYCVTKEIDGIYKCASTTHLDQKEILYQKDSEITSKWITAEQWRYYREDIKDTGMGNYEHINLIVEGIDTFVELKMFNIPLHVDYNMFRPQIMSIKELYRPPYSYIFFIFSPVRRYVTRLYDEYKNKSRLYPECPPTSYAGDCYVFMARKMQSSFGSIIGPSIPSMGISGPAHIEAYNETAIRGILNRITEEAKDWILDVTVNLAQNKRNVINGTITTEILGYTVKENVSVQADEDDEYSYHTKITIPKEKINRWWPTGYGDQTLYNLTIKFVSFQGEESSKVIRVGFRTIKLIEESLGQGNSFYFKVNERSVFMKGTILAPLSLQPELAQDEEKLKSILKLAVAQNMNMIRIWGGGIYQSDAFYDLADEMGILIWQDFMFTDYSYPTNKDFLKNVKEEVKYQVRRLYNHPSLAIFCGNDEGELSIAENRYNQTRSNITQDSYRSLFVKTIKQEFNKLIPNQGIFVTSTPSNGGSGSEISRNPNNPASGDVHYLNLEGDPFDHQTYTPVPRFVSAYGIQSLPKFESFQRDTQNFSDLYIDSEFMQSRQHWPDGFAKLRKTMEHQFKLPAPDDRQKFTEAFIFYSQVVQAYAMRIQTEIYRSHRNIQTQNGFGKTSGTLYWHFNDVWTAPSWSGIDFYGQWKVVQYYVPKFFAPTILTGIISPNGNGKKKLEVFIISDINNFSNITAKLKTGRWDSLGTNSETSLRVSVDADSSKLIYTVEDIDDFMSKRNCSVKNCFFYLELEANKELIAPENFVLPYSLKDCNTGQPNVQIYLKKLPYVEIYEVTVTTDKNALFVWVDAHAIDGYFSDNGFLLITAEKKIFFYSRQKITVEELRRQITVRYIGHSRLSDQ